MGGPSPINGDAGTGHEAVGGGCKEQDGCAEFGDFTPASHGNLGSELFVFHGIVEKSAVHFSGKWSGAESIDGDAGACGLEGLGSHELDDTAFASGVGRAVGESDHPEDG